MGELINETAGIANCREGVEEGIGLIVDKAASLDDATTRGGRGGYFLMAIVEDEGRRGEGEEVGVHDVAEFGGKVQEAEGHGRDWCRSEN